MRSALPAVCLVVALFLPLGARCDEGMLLRLGTLAEEAETAATSGADTVAFPAPTVSTAPARQAPAPRGTSPFGWPQTGYTWNTVPRPDVRLPNDPHPDMLLPATPRIDTTRPLWHNTVPELPTVVKPAYHPPAIVPPTVLRPNVERPGYAENVPHYRPPQIDRPAYNRPPGQPPAYDDRTIRPPAVTPPLVEPPAVAPPRVDPQKPIPPPVIKPAW